MKFRSVIGIIAGAISWWAALIAFSLIASIISPELREMGREVVRNDNYGALTTPVLAMMVFIYLWINPLSGFITVQITKSRTYAGYVAVPLTLYAVHAHWYRLWGILPDWYNLVVVIMIPPLIYLGGSLTKYK